MGLTTLSRAVGRGLVVLALLAGFGCDKRARNHEGASPAPRAAPSEPQPEPPPRLPVVIQVYCAAWASPCQMWPELERDPQLQSALVDTGARVEQRDLTEGDEAPAKYEAERRQVDSVPTVLVLAPDGAETRRFHGLPSVDDLARAIRSALDGRRP